MALAVRPLSLLFGSHSCRHVSMDLQTSPSPWPNNFTVRDMIWARRPAGSPPTPNVAAISGQPTRERLEEPNFNAPPPPSPPQIIEHTVGKWCRVLDVVDVWCWVTINVHQPYSRLVYKQRVLIVSPVQTLSSFNHCLEAELTSPRISSESY